MPILPSKVQDLLDFSDMHAPIWSANAVAIGLTVPQATAFNNAAGAARTAYTAHLAAISATKVATMAQADAVRSLRALGGDTIRLIKAKAESSANPDTVYMLAQIPAPSAASPLPPPGTPFDFKAGLNTDGSITLSFKCNNPQGSSGTVYQVRRKLGTETSFIFIGAVGARKFTDFSLPIGTSTAQYTVTGQRAESIGAPSSPFTVMFGHAGGTGGMTIAGQFEGDGDSFPMQQAA